MANKRLVDNCPLCYRQFYLFGIKPFVPPSGHLIRQLLISVQNLIQLKSSSFMQLCQFLNAGNLNSISSWSFLIRDLSTLLRNYLLSNNQTLLPLTVIFYLQFFQTLCISIMFFIFTPYDTPKYSPLICISYFITFFGFSIQPGKQFFLINSKKSILLILLNPFIVTLYFCYFLQNFLILSLSLLGRFQISH